MNQEDLSGYRICHLDRDMHNILYEQRVIHGMTQKQAAEKAGVTLQQYQKFEWGERNILTASFRIACRIIEALGMNITDFYHGEYVIGEEIYFVGKKMFYKKTGRPVDEDITEKDDSPAISAKGTAASPVNDPHE